MIVELVEVTFDHKSVLRRLLELYQYDSSEFEYTDVNSNGEFGYKYLDHYWTEPHRTPLFIIADGKYAGFVLLSRCPACLSQGNETMSVSEFFVMRKYRRKGIGRAAAIKAFRKFPGLWEIRQVERNLPAQKFWRKIIGDYTDGDYKEEVLDNDHWKGPIQTFRK